MHPDPLMRPGGTLAHWQAAKRAAPGDAPRIPMDGETALVLLVEADFEHHAPLFSNWRNAAHGWFFTDFEASATTTLAWLRTRYLESDELLFLVQVQGRALGHVGIGGFDVLPAGASIDHVLLDPAARGSGLMQRALQTLIAWAGESLNIHHLRLEVFADNPRALRSYRKAGFEILSRRTFACSRSEDRHCWMPLGAGGLPHGPLREVLRLEVRRLRPSTVPPTAQDTTGALSAMDPHEQFAAEVKENTARLREARELHELGLRFVRETLPYRYSYNFRWLGRPLIQFPQDLIALQELIWQIRPRAIVETGVAHGGSLIFHASMLHLLGGDGIVVGVDIDIRAHNRQAIEEHPMSTRIRLIQGSSIEAATVAAVRGEVAGRAPVLVVLDSNHSHEHVLQELRQYSPLVGAGSYLVVLDTVVEDLPKALLPDRPWGPGNSPKSAVHAFLAETDRFVVDTDIDARLLVTVAPGGWLRCVADLPPGSPCEEVEPE